MLRTAIAFLWILTTPTTALAVGVPGPLVDSEWLADHRDQVVLLDVRSDPAGFSAEDGNGLNGRGHIPGAVLVPTNSLRTTRQSTAGKLRGMAPPAEDFEKRMRESGVSDGSVIVITHPGKKAKQVTNAARLYWTLHYFAHERVALLDGGTLRWALDERPISTQKTTPERGNFRALSELDNILATEEQVETAMDDYRTQLVDARPLGYYLGLDKKPYVAGYGHIPTARALPYTLLLNKMPLTFRSAETIASVAEAMGINPQDPMIVYCNSGRLSSSTWFALSELVGTDNVRMYDGSMHEWTRISGNPLTRMKLE